MLRERLGLRIREYPTTRASPEELARNPRARARDLHEVFRDEDPANAARTRAPQPDAEGFRFIQGRGGLFGGFIEVLEFLKGTRFWPGRSSGRGSCSSWRRRRRSRCRSRWRWLRNYRVQGVFERSSGLLFGRPRNYSREEKAALERVLLDVWRASSGTRTRRSSCRWACGPRWTAKPSACACLESVVL
ncbi:hypothetical protein ATI61_111197 [Archangium gephyra]|uniref:Muramoyltetrapeptide carboxypeptidase n=1 Tax=Archangium gephyra TaxID=48 RepID=A0AAC8QH05_9BACT|nr:hypothetical protein [Archangium gephyra]AKJ07239.1 Muramoyltetrapeptide carboxypeptidase [Archangium gephyra]REG26647.1 hypothetical protein ATI61_111197 [Archangium gephyra]